MRSNLTKSTLITADWLQKHGACKEAVEIVALEWPKGTRLTPAALTRADELNLDVSWLAQRLPTPAWYAYHEAVASARQTYRAALVAALTTALSTK